MSRNFGSLCLETGGDNFVCLLGEITEVVQKVEAEVEAEDYEKLALELENASPLKIMDKALQKFGNDIAIAFRYCFYICFVVCRSNVYLFSMIY